MSGGNKAVELQLQMRQNAEDMMSFMRELENWETDIKKKDEELRRGGLPEEQVLFFVCLIPTRIGGAVIYPGLSCLLSRSLRRVSRQYATRTTSLK